MITETGCPALEKPFNTAELVGKLRALQRGATAPIKADEAVQPPQPAQPAREESPGLR